MDKTLKKLDKLCTFASIGSFIASLYLLAVADKNDDADKHNKAIRFCFASFAIMVGNLLLDRNKNDEEIEYID